MSGPWSYLDARDQQARLQIADGDGAGVEHAGGECRIDTGQLECLAEVFGGARTARGDQWYAADLAHGAQLGDVVAAAHAVAGHAIEHDFAGAAFLDFT